LTVNFRAGVSRAAASVIFSASRNKYSRCGFVKIFQGQGGGFDVKNQDGMKRRGKKSEKPGAGPAPDQAARPTLLLVISFFFGLSFSFLPPRNLTSDHRWFNAD